MKLETDCAELRYLPVIPPMKQVCPLTQVRACWVGLGPRSDSSPISLRKASYVAHAEETLYSVEDVDVEAFPCRTLGIASIWPAHQHNRYSPPFVKIAVEPKAIFAVAPATAAWGRRGLKVSSTPHVSSMATKSADLTRP
jgi:hypothetical protein